MSVDKIGVSGPFQPHFMNDLQDEENRNISVWSLLFGRDGLGEVPQFEGVVLGHGDQAGLHGVEGQRPHAVKVAPQRVLRVPRLPERGLLIGRQLKVNNMH